MQDPSSQPVAREHNSSDQFMVLQDSCRQKINLERNETLLDSTADSTDILESPWIHYSASAGEHYSTMSAHPQEKMVHGKGMRSRSNMDLCVSAKISRQHHECYSCKQSFSGSSAGKFSFNMLESYSFLSMSSIRYFLIPHLANLAVNPSLHFSGIRANLTSEP
ncbi:hypothetical protein SLEP1_g32397 [Rubroshorea leprosula]|uniref:Uncharacterized protein n=1 Tax=Rubroshorea leprosula TaxID=152421 RepID=A0AAV5KDD2_9ROSI|nr:hypothetical protein SLEP1_g32397 [Rubroshorea leprosula]